MIHVVSFFFSNQIDGYYVPSVTLGIVAIADRRRLGPTLVFMPIWITLRYLGRKKAI